MSLADCLRLGVSYISTESIRAKPDRQSETKQNNKDLAQEWADGTC